MPFRIAISALLATIAADLACAQKTVSESNTKRSEAAAAAAAPFAADTGESVSTEITFAKGKAELTPASKKALERVLAEGRRKGEIDDVVVITWADEEYPSPDIGKLSKQQRELVASRNHEIKKYLASRDRKLDVEAYNMAERANALERMINSSEARVKRSLESAGIPDTSSKIKMPAKASKALIMVILDKED